MTDRELLEAAAKAAGWVYQAPGQADVKRPELDGWIDPATGDQHWRDTWNPLTDDGAALRLAVTCRITDLVDAVGALVFYETPPADKFAMVRRAIVRAAAAMAPA